MNFNLFFTNLFFSSKQTCVLISNGLSDVPYNNRQSLGILNMCSNLHFSFHIEHTLAAESAPRTTGADLLWAAFLHFCSSPLFKCCISMFICIFKNIQIVPIVYKRSVCVGKQTCPFDQANVLQYTHVPKLSTTMAVILPYPSWSQFHHSFKTVIWAFLVIRCNK